MRKLSNSEILILQSYFDKDPNWKRATVKEACNELRLPFKKVYKWGYDLKARKMKRIFKAKIANKNNLKFSTKL